VAQRSADVRRGRPGDARALRGGLRDPQRDRADHAERRRAGYARGRVRPPRPDRRGAEGPRPLREALVAAGRKPGHGPSRAPPAPPRRPRPGPRRDARGGSSVSDVFISYARSTAAQASAAADALRAAGYSVWLDEDLPAHRP